MWSWFNHSIEDDCLYAILDNTGWYYIDKDYLDEGVNEGWLIYTGHTLTGNNTIVYLYRLSHSGGIE